MRGADSFPGRAGVVTAEERSGADSLPPSLPFPSLPSPLLSASLFAPVAELLPPGCRGAVGRFLYHCGKRAARMLQSDEGEGLSALPQAGQCHRRDSVGGLQGE